MSNFFKTVFVLAFFGTLALHAKAQPNGCGSGWNTALVPDKIRLLQCTMKSACDAHDRCYGLCDKRVDGECAYRRCRPNGDKAGKPECRVNPVYLELERDALNRRSACDRQLALQIITDNPDRWACKAVAIIYREAVKKWGNPSFSGYGSWEMPAAWNQTQEDYEKAIALFIENASEAEFRQLVESFETGRGNVNFCARLSYVQDQGLKNIDPKEDEACSPLLKSATE